MQCTADGLRCSACRDTYIKAETSESPNDRNDRAIRVAARWYAARLGARMPVLLLSNDADCRARAEQEGLSALSVQVGDLSWRVGEGGADAVTSGRGVQTPPPGVDSMARKPHLGCLWFGRI